MCSIYFSLYFVYICFTNLFVPMWVHKCLQMLYPFIELTSLSLYNTPFCLLLQSSFKSLLCLIGVLLYFLFPLNGICFSIPSLSVCVCLEIYALYVGVVWIWCVHGKRWAQDLPMSPSGSLPEDLSPAALYNILFEKHQFYTPMTGEDRLTGTTDAPPKPLLQP